ncbi:glycoside hydrolase family 16 protein [Podospora didyma]|uniref:Glycoside hydrolase family 16 protein n=1 Tax=Podospora didyma TaxID=330526 RepID=A0AAE0NFY1_9PEZI|nr:glycoside hydrolase family 16 protein [Podospora didyma]
MMADPTLRPFALLVAAASLVAVARGAYPLTTDSNCHCYKTNATSSNYFAHHDFFDFRALTQYANIPKPLGSFEANAQAPPVNAFFTSTPWTSRWAIQNWNNTALLYMNNTDVNDATVKMTNTPNNIYIERNNENGANGQSSYLTMRTVRHSDFQSASEIESKSNGYQFLSIRMYARTKGATGAVTAMFTYRPPPQPQNISLVQEADLEIRTRDPPNYVQYTNQPAWNSTSDIPEATRNASLPGGRRWSDWAHYRMDWTPGSSTWYVNGQLASTISFQVPRDPAQVMFNSWSDGGSWSGHMPVNAEAYLQMQWIEMVYNNTDPGSVKTGKCVNVCSIDETTKIGQPVLITGGTSATNPTPNAPGACAAARYGQCAGKTWNGCKTCAAGTTCKFQNDYYSQCL